MSLKKKKKVQCIFLIVIWGRLEKVKGEGAGSNSKTNKNLCSLHPHWLCGLLTLQLFLSPLLHKFALTHEPFWGYCHLCLMLHTEHGTQWFVGLFWGQPIAKSMMHRFSDLENWTVVQLKEFLLVCDVPTVFLNRERTYRYLSRAVMLLVWWGWSLKWRAYIQSGGRSMILEMLSKNILLGCTSYLAYILIS